MDLRYNVSMLTDKSDKIKFYRLQDEFDAAMRSSTKWENLVRSWFIPIWPFAFLFWKVANNRAKKSIHGMKQILSKYPQFTEIGAAAAKSKN
jgi:hypothetical protein